jgi:hypothetical protein
MKLNVSSTTIFRDANATGSRAVDCIRGCVPLDDIPVHRLRRFPLCLHLGEYARMAQNSWRVGFVAMAVILTVVFAGPRRARAARVSGILTSYEKSTPLVSRDLHFQNIITGDAYLAPTHSDGSFGVSLPPGKYRLQTETGAVLVHSIVVDRTNIELGRITELAPLALQRWWQSQTIAPSRLNTPAPSTAYLMTSDTTPLPPTATTVPKPEIDWTKPPPETQASQAPNVVTGMATSPLLAPHTPSAATPAASGWMGGTPYVPPLAAPGNSKP